MEFCRCVRLAMRRDLDDNGFCVVIYVTKACCGNDALDWLGAGVVLILVLGCLKGGSGDR